MYHKKVGSMQKYSFETWQKKTLRHDVALVSGQNMAFFTSAIGILKTLVVAIGAGLAVWGVINLLEGYGNDNPDANTHVR